MHPGTFSEELVALGVEKGYCGHHNRVLCKLSPYLDAALYDYHLFKAHKQLNNEKVDQGQQILVQYKL